MTDRSFTAGLASKHPKHALALAFVLCGFAGVSTGGTVTWTGASDNNWATPENWSGGLPGSTTDVVFYAENASNLSNYLSAATTVQSLTFSNNAINSVCISVSTNAPLKFNNNARVTVDAGHHAILGDGIKSSSIWALTLNSSTWTVAAGASLTNAVRMHQNNSSQTFTKAGEGLLVLAGDSGGSGSISMTWAINAGILRAAKTGTIGNSGNAITVADGASLELQAMTSANPNGILTLNGSGVGGFGALRCLAGSSTLTSGSGSIQLSSGSAIGVDAGGTLKIDQVIQGSGGLTKVGDGSLLLTSSTNSYSGATAVSKGTLIVNGGLLASSGISVASNATLAGVGVISNTVTVQAGGVLSPGTNGVGTLTLAASPVTQGATLVTTVKADGTCTALNLSGSLDVSGMTLQVIDTNSLNKAYPYVIVTTTQGTVSGRFSSTNLPQGWDTLRQGGQMLIVYGKKGTRVSFY